MNLFEIITDAIETAEEDHGPGQGALKKEQVVNIINAFVDIPSVPEFVEKEILSIVIDLIVFIYNKYKVFPKNQ